MSRFAGANGRGPAPSCSRTARNCRPPTVVVGVGIRPTVELAAGRGPARRQRDRHRRAAAHLGPQRLCLRRCRVVASTRCWASRCAWSTGPTRSTAARRRPARCSASTVEYAPVPVLLLRPVRPRAWSTRARSRRAPTTGSCSAAHPRCGTTRRPSSSRSGCARPGARRDERQRLGRDRRPSRTWCRAGRPPARTGRSWLRWPIPRCRSADLLCPRRVGCGAAPVVEGVRPRRGGGPARRGATSLARQAPRLTRPITSAIDHAAAPRTAAGPSRYRSGV